MSCNVAPNRRTGTLFTVALVVGLLLVLEDVAAGGVLFLGLALTFAALYLTAPS